jgi:inosine/xanthosine triphosphatase
VVVALGSTRAPKVEALRRVLAALAAHDAALRGAELIARDVPHTAPAMPVTLDDLMQGARDRAERALRDVRDGGRAADLGVGLEGGLEVRALVGGRRAFLMSWAYVTNGRRGGYGCGGAIEVPPPVAAGVLDEGRELSEVVDALAAQSDTRSRQGAWGVLTAGLLDRTRSFELALLNAMAPFYNPQVYS